MTDNLTAFVERYSFFFPDTFKLQVICKETHKGPIFILVTQKLSIIGGLILYVCERLLCIGSTPLSL